MSDFPSFRPGDAGWRRSNGAYVTRRGNAVARQAADSNSGRPGLAQIWALRGPSGSDRWAGPMSGSCCRWWRCSACRGLVVMVAGLLQRADGLNGPFQGPAGPYWDWPTPAVWQAVRPNLTGTGMSCGRVRSTTAIGGGGSSLPRSRHPADPEPCYFSPSSVRPRDACFGETAMGAR